jgi:hypothetical protein
MAKKIPLRWADVVNNVLLRLISTGQLPLIALIALLGLMVYRTPQEHIVEVWRILQMMLDKRSGLGYGLAAVASGGWVVHTRIQRRRFEREHERIAETRNKAQQAYFNDQLQSSRKK